VRGAAHRTLKWRLTRRNRTVAHGTIRARRRHAIISLAHLRRGRYTLRVNGGIATTITIT
jgi:hypothetical protein